MVDLRKITGQGIHYIFFLALTIFLVSACDKNNGGSKPETDITIFIVNDLHAQLDNFAKIKHIVDVEKADKKVLLVSGGDIFSGNAVVDNYPEKGYPVIDLMNKVGFDVAVIGNHEYDYGPLILKDRLAQAEFPFICANVSTTGSVVPQPLAFTTITLDDLNITFLGLVETNGKQDAIIPSTHPWRVQDFAFERPQEVVARYAQLKVQESADLLIALTHLGFQGNSTVLGDAQLAADYPYFDLIIGGHSHQLINEVVNEIPIFQAGSNLNYLGKIEIRVKDKVISKILYTQINLNEYNDIDEGIKTLIDGYNEMPYLDEIIGFSAAYQDRTAVGCFIAEALKTEMGVDVSFQNTGGVRATLAAGDITQREIFEIVPFNNLTVTYSMTVGEIKQFLIGSSAGFYYAGIKLEQDRERIIVMDQNGKELADDQVLTVGLNDYIPAVFDSLFPANGKVGVLTDAETLISYLRSLETEVDYTNCDHYFRYQ